MMFRISVIALFALSSAIPVCGYANQKGGKNDGQQNQKVDGQGQNNKDDGQKGQKDDGQKGDKDDGQGQSNKDDGQKGQKNDSQKGDKDAGRKDGQNKG